MSLLSTSSHRTDADADHYTLVPQPEYAAVVSDAIRAVSTLATRRAAG